MSEMNLLCATIAEAMNSAVVKVFDEIPNRAQIGDFFQDAVLIVNKGNEAASWDKRDRLAGLLRTSAHLSLSLSRSYAKLSDEL